MATTNENCFPAPLAMLALDPTRQQIVSVLVKRTYDLGTNGQCCLAEEQLPLDTRHLRKPGGPAWAAEPDVVPYKVATDFLVFGKAYAPGGHCTQMDVSVQMEKRGKTIRVFGDRKCSHRGNGSPSFSKPEPFESMPLDYNKAYGGVDFTVSFPTKPTTFGELLSRLGQHPGAYPRNRQGKGYVV